MIKRMSFGAQLSGFATLLTLESIYPLVSWSPYLENGTTNSLPHMIVVRIKCFNMYAVPRT